MDERREVTDTKTKPENQIDYIELHASDIEKPRRFTTRSLDGRLQITVLTTPASTTDGWRWFYQGLAAGGAGVLLVIYASDLAAVQQKVKAAGGRVVKEIFSFPAAGGFHFVDPNGNELAAWSE
jgi:predicted enzyme related to lactoylglutathione lyase